jgi:hypothetical protein
MPSQRDKDIMATPALPNDGASAPSTFTTDTTVGKINVAELRAKVRAQFTAMVSGIDTELTDIVAFVFREQPIQKTQVVSRLQARIAAAENTKVARLALHAAVAAEALSVADTAPLLVDLKSFLQSRYGKSNPKLQTFGITQAKTPQKSTLAKARGVAKGRVTRAVLGTKGKKQRKAAVQALAAGAPTGATSAAPASAIVAGAVTEGK